MNLVQSVKKGSRRDTLEALRDILATTIQSTDSGRDIAALSKRLMEVMAELDSLPNPSSSLNPLQKAQANTAQTTRKSTPVRKARSD